MNNDIYDLAGRVSKEPGVKEYTRDGGGAYYMYNLTILADHNQTPYSLSMFGDEPWAPCVLGDQVSLKFKINNKDGKSYNNIEKGTLQGGTAVPPSMPTQGGNPPPTAGGNQPPTLQPTPHTPANAPHSNSGERFDGATVGNALNVASTILGAGATVESLVGLSQRVLKAGIYLRKGDWMNTPPQAGQPSPTPTQSMQSHSTDPATDFDDDTPY